LSIIFVSPKYGDYKSGVIVKFF